MAENSVKYYVRIDNSYVETDLETAQKKIKSAGRSANNELEQQGKKSADAIGGAADDAAGKMVQASRKGSQSFQDISTSAGKADKSIDDIDADSLTEVKKQAEDTSDALGKMGESAEGAAGKTGAIGGAVSKMGGVVGGALLGIGGAAVAVGKQAVSGAVDLDKAMNQFAASTGVTNDKLGDYEETLKNIYANHYGESFEDVAGAMASVKQQMGDLSQTDLQNVTEGVYALSDVFGSDFNETLRGVDQLMLQFGLSAEEALDLMATGSQAGLDYTSELGDNIAEYGGKFAQAGYSADEYFQLLKNGTENGSYNLDKVNDAINEVTNKLADGSIEESLGLFSNSTQEVFKAWQNGGASQKDVIDSIVQDINNCTNEQDALTLAATAFGTMGEDANLDFVRSLTSVGDAFDTTKGKMDSMKEVKYDDLSSAMEELGRSVEMLLLPLGDSLIPLIQQIIDQIIPSLEENLPLIINAIVELASGMAPIVGELLPPILELLSSLMPIFLQLIQEILPPIIDLVKQILPPIIDLVETILPPLIQLFSALIEPLAEILSAILPPLIEVFTALLEPIAELINQLLPPLTELLDGLKPIFDALMPIIQAVGELFSKVLGGAIEAVMPIIENVMDIFGGLIDFITGVFSGNWEQAWNGIVDMFKGIFNLIPTIVEGIINGAISIINGIIWGINQLTGLIGIPAIPEIPKVSIPRFKVGIDYVPSDMFPAFLDKGERVLTAEENAQYTALGGLSGLEARYAAIRQPSLPESPSLSIPQGKYIAQIHVDLDGREVARATAPFMGSQLSWEEF